MKRWMVLLLTAGLFLGCATSRDIQVLDREIDRLHSRVNLLQKENESIKNELVTLKSDLASENQKLKAELLIRLESLQTEIRTLATGVEEYREYLKRPTKEVDRVRADVEGRLRMIEEREKTFGEKNKAQEEKIKGLEDRLKGLEAKANGSVSKETLPELKGVSTGMGDLYKEAYETFYRGDWEGARKKFEAFLKHYPNTELSDNAQFWIGETYYQKKDFEKAILEYEKAIVKYPEGDKISAALFKQALAFLELGDKASGRNLLKRVIEKYPHSEQAEMAKKKLETVK